MFATPIQIAILSVLVSLLLLLLRIEQPIPPVATTSAIQLELYDETYRYDRVVAPTATGTKLRLLSWVTTKSPLGPAIRRHLLLRNKITAIRQLASRVPDDRGAPLYHPMHRLSRAERDAHDLRGGGDDAASLLDQVIRTGYGVQSSHVLAYHNAYKNFTTTPSAVLQTTMSAVDQLQPIYKPFAVWPPPTPSLLHDLQFSAAASTARYKTGNPLSVWDGVPVAFKDCINIAGYVNTRGSQYVQATSRRPSTAEEEDYLVRRFRALGAIVLPPTSMVEGGVSPVGYNVHYSGPFNPHSRRHYSGGSSGGSAVAVALGLVPAAIGFDGGGSIRTPASFSGVVGLAFGFGRAPQSGFVGRTMVKTGPLVRSVDDAALAYATMARPTEEEGAGYYDRLYDGGMVGVPRPHLGSFLKHRRTGAAKDLAGVTLGIFRPWFDDAAPDIVHRCQSVVDRLTARGATVKNIAIPNLGTLRLAHAVIITTEFALEWDAAYHDYAERDLLEANTRITVGLGSSVTALDAIAAERMRGWAFDYVQSRIFRDAGVDAIVTPSTSIVAPPIKGRAMEVGESNTPLQVELLKYAFLANLLGLPSISLPVGMGRTTEAAKTKDDGEGRMPIGLMMTGPQWAEDVLLRLASGIELIDPPDDFVDVVQLSSSSVGDE